MPKVTIRDVAKHAGVSFKTVSRVINAEPFVKETTRKKVQAAIDELGYVVSLPAKRLSSGQSYTLGLIFHNASWHYIQDVQKGVIETARKFGYHTLMHPCDVRRAEDIDEILTMLSQRLVDGLIFTPPADNAQSLIQKLGELDFPFICLSPKDRDNIRLYVTTSDRQGAFEMTQYLIRLGHIRIGFIHGPAEQYAPHDRFLGYKQALADSGIKFNADIVAYGNDYYESGQIATQKLLTHNPQPTAIFSNNDEMAAGAIAAIFEAGLRVPQDISVAGFDNIPLAAQIWPPLTTVEQPIFEMASHATTHLVKMLNGENDFDKELKIPTQVIIRKSTANYLNER
jgi:LacI family transcriptional regulator